MCICCPCSWSIAWDAFPAVCIELLMFWSYYVYLYEMCIVLVDDLAKKIIYLIIFNSMFIACQVVYFITMCHNGWYVPESYVFTNEFCRALSSTDNYHEIFQLLIHFCRERGIRVYTRTSEGNLRFCMECKHLKPDRAHHCTTCKICVIKMDHHCPWVNNCIGYTNYKFFLIYVLYSAIYCSFYSATSLEYCINFFGYMKTWREIQIVFTFLITLIIGIILWTLLCYHLSLICKNQTTLEAMHPPTFSTVHLRSFDLGSCGDNFVEQCGTNCCLWCLPVYTAQGDGVYFPVLRY